MVCPGFFLKHLLDFTYIRSKDDEKIISISSVNNEYDLNGVDGQDNRSESEGE